ncbi:hypothetical protein C7441_104342 [Pseudaminobacter salicylatoxidans]|uniref:Uncharacterized protein n=1 Tax=Pseudaminobacter salicylatoxidans TaxID=93369 RepID=A0A316C5N2_PSESE|nr:hypothetical protein [Pseudaminobacter salicylatoxidans]PWJ85072.1 hypothetical protein C7441_104342 [Pseudaminobacter salicylatoxidans]
MDRNVKSRTRLLPLVLAGGLLAALAVPASAGGPDLVYADSFGNLIVESGAGYKRIIVGQGHRVRQLAQFTRSNERPTIYPDDNGYVSAAAGDCWRPPVLVKGRSYMYGFDQGVIPLQGGPCR